MTVPMAAKNKTGNSPQLRLATPEKGTVRGDSIDRRIARLIDCVHEAADDPQRWAAFVEALSDVLQLATPGRRDPAAVLTLLQGTSAFSLGPRENRSATLQELHGLTPAELRVVVELLSGLTVREIAARCGIATGTVRCHLKRIFAKTGTRRQSELMRVLLSPRED